MTVAFLPGKLPRMGLGMRTCPSLTEVGTLAVLALLAVVTSAQFLVLPALPATPANDMAMHTAMVEGMIDAFRSGQFLPRLLSAADHVPDIPVFQYYGFMTGLIGLPGVLAGLTPFSALMVGLTVCRLFGFGGIYLAARLLGGNRAVALLAATVYALTPYLITNLYGRVDVAESIAHCELPFLVVGLATAITRSTWAGAGIIAATVFSFALTHPIFLLYGTLCLGLMMVASGSPAAIAAGTTGTAIALLLSAFQWYPALITDHLLAGHFLKVSPFGAAALTSASGLFGLPVTLAERGWVAPEAPYVYLTPGWLTLPTLVGLAVLLTRTRQPLKRGLILALLVPGSLYLFMSYSPVDIFRYLPRTTWALQMPYRLLAFVALFSALALPLLLPRLRGSVCLGLLAATVIQSAPVLLHSTYRDPLLVPAQTFASRDYLIRDRDGLGDPDHWLADYGKPLYPRPPNRDDKPGEPPPNTFTDPDGFLRADNLLTPYRPKEQLTYAHVVGDSTFATAGARLWLADPDQPEKPLSEVRQLAPGPFSVMFSVPPNPKSLQLVSASPPEFDTRKLDQPKRGIHLSLVESLPDRTFHRDADPPHLVLRLKGTTIATDAPTTLSVATPAAPDVPLGHPVAVGPGAFEVMIDVPDQPGDYVLVPSRFVVPGKITPGSRDFRRLSIKIESYEFIPVTATGAIDGHLTVPASAVDRVITGAYQRRFAVRRDVWNSTDGVFTHPVTVELPLAYSPLFDLSQGGQTLTAKPNEEGRAVVITRTLAVPIEARFTMPILCWLAAAAGFAMIATCSRLKLLRF